MRIIELKDHVGQQVTVEAWISRMRKQGKKLVFVSLFDGTGEVQATIKQAVLGEEFSKIEEVYKGASLKINGTVIEDTRANLGFEIQVSSFEVLHPSDETYEQTVTHESNTDVKLDKRHIVIRGPKSSSVLRFQSHVLKYLREYFYSKGLEEVFPPLIVEAQAEGGSELFEIQYFDREAYLTQSSQLYLEAAIFSLRDVFCILPSFRAEKSKTRRHLTEYRHVETEHAFMDFEGLVAFIEGMIKHVIDRVIELDQDILKLWDRDLKPISTPFKRVTYDDAITILKEEYDIEIPHGEDISDAPERQLIEHFGEPVILHKFPKKMKPFYHKIDEENPELTKSADFLFPQCGELIGSGERETDIDSMLERMAQMDPPVNPDEYYWYLDLRRYGSVRHSGFGMGLERFIIYLLGVEHIREITLFPRTVTRLSP
ncbi:MAG: asparagine--tRNA ligase [Candidatus Heimdallarchaeota archaeon]|nr:asparagine--tRNA ligase [Candidatus Heimdallarchaeota archaeon]